MPALATAMAPSGWIVSDDPNDICLALLTYEGPGETTLSFAADHKNKYMVTIVNSNWSAKDGERYAIAFLFDGQRVFNGPGLGGAIAGKAGFNAAISENIVSEFSRSSSVSIFLNEKLMDSLELRGSAAALAKVETCLNKKQRMAEREMHEAQRLDHIPKDPFAQP